MFRGFCWKLDRFSLCLLGRVLLWARVYHVRPLSVAGHDSTRCTPQTWGAETRVLNKNVKSKLYTSIISTHITQMRSHFSSLLLLKTKVEFLNHMVILFIIITIFIWYYYSNFHFLKKLFSSDRPFYFLIFLKVAILMSKILSWFFICTSIMINDVEHLLKCLMVIYISLVFISLLSEFKWGSLLSLLSFKCDL